MYESMRRALGGRAESDRRTMANYASLAIAVLGLLAAPAAAQNTPQLVLQGRFSPAGGSNGVATLPQTFS